MRVSIIAKAYVVASVLGFAFHVQAAEGTKEHSMTGCLRKGADAGTFKLTDLGLEKGPKTVEIAESRVDLSGHLGHKVEITGSTVVGKDPAAHTMKITAMKHLSETCP